MSELEKNVESLKDEIINIVDRFEKENGMFVLDIKYDGISKKVKCAIAGGNPKFINA